MDFNHVVSIYNNTKSLRETAKQCGIGTGKVRKILVTCGMYDSPRFREIQDLYDSGKTISEISEITGLSGQCIVSYVPYTRGERTGESQTPNAIRIRKHRANLLKNQGG